MYDNKIRRGSPAVKQIGDMDFSISPTFDQLFSLRTVVTFESQTPASATYTIAFCSSLFQQM